MYGEVGEATTQGSHFVDQPTTDIDRMVIKKVKYTRKRRMPCTVLVHVQQSRQPIIGGKTAASDA